MKKMRKIIVMTLALLCAVALHADAQNIYSYFWYSVDNTTHVLKKNENALHEGNRFMSSTSVTNLSGWWGVEGSVTINNRINVTGNTWLILCNGSTLNAKQGIFIDKNATLTIYANSEDDTTRGKLIAEGGGTDWAAIGGNKNTQAGKLIIHGGNIHAEAKHNNAAGIGGGNGDGSGMNTITIFGGKVEALGKSSGAGIGGGQHNNHLGTITIYGGQISATGGNYAAGIGGGEDRGGWDTYIYGGNITATGGKKGAGVGGGEGGDGGNITIGGTAVVNANAGAYGACIGGGEGGNSGTITIKEGTGTVNANGKTSYDIQGVDGGGAGIGSGFKGEVKTITIEGMTINAKGNHNSALSHGGAGIGSGYKGKGGVITIIGGNVNSTGGNGGAGIGGGEESDGGTVDITGGRIEAIGLNFAMAISGGYKGSRGNLNLPTDYKVTKRVSNVNTTVNSAERVKTCQDVAHVYVEECDHQDYFYTLTDDNTKHIAHCKYCEHSLEAEAHSPANGICDKCGYETETYTITLYKAAESGMEYDTGTQYKVIPGQPFELPAIRRLDIPSYMMFEGWLQDPTTAPDTWETTTGSEGLLDPGVLITPTADVKLYARYDYIYGIEWTWAEDYSTATVEVFNEEYDPHVEVVSLTVTPSQTTVNPTIIGPGSVTYTATATYTRPLNDHTYTFTDTRVVPLYISVSLGEEDNTETLTTNDGAIAEVTLTDRILYKDDSWNTLCLPFDLDDGDDDDDHSAVTGGLDGLILTGTPLVGATLKELTSADFDSTTGTLTLNFDDATSIKAGKPYLIKWDNGSPLTSADLVFNGVTIRNETNDETCNIDEDKSITFKGTYTKLTYNTENRQILFLGQNNTLYFPQPSAGNIPYIAAQRAYFELDGLTAGDKTSNACTFVLNFGDSSEQNGIVSLSMDSKDAKGYWYSLSGIKLSGKPTQKGIYINNGKKVIVK